MKNLIRSLQDFSFLNLLAFHLTIALQCAALIIAQLRKQIIDIFQTDRAQESMSERERKKTKNHSQGKTNSIGKNFAITNIEGSRIRYCHNSFPFCRVYFWKKGICKSLKNPLEDSIEKKLLFFLLAVFRSTREWGEWKMRNVGRVWMSCYNEPKVNCNYLVLKFEDFEREKVWRFSRQRALQTAKMSFNFSQFRKSTVLTSQNTKLCLSLHIFRINFPSRVFHVISIQSYFPNTPVFKQSDIYSSKHP